MAGTSGAQEPPKNRYEKLENRISTSPSWRRFLPIHDISSVSSFPGELEAMLKDQNPLAADTSSQSSISPSAQTQSPSLPTYAGLTNSSIPTLTFHTPDLGLPQNYEPSSVTFTGVTSSPKSFFSLVDTHPESVKTPAAVVSELQGDTSSFLSHGLGYDVIWPAWPRDLPSPSLVRHL